MIDNKSTTLHQFLLQHIRPGTTLSIQCGKISFYALHELLRIFPDGVSLRVLTGGVGETLTSVAAHSSDLGRRTKLDLTTATHQVLRQRSSYRLRTGFCGINMVLIENDTERIAAQFTRPDFDLQLLGLYPADTPAILVPQNAESSSSFSTLFAQTWQDADDFTERFINRLQQGLDLTDPKHQYRFTLSHLFADYDRLAQQEKIKRSGFFTSKIWSLLYNFQKDAVLGAISKIEKYGGCIIADSVGLGKTFEALGVMKYYQQRNYNVLVLCPKRLYENWAVYRNPDRRNILIEDRFNYRVLYHTDLSRETGTSNEIDLENFTWENFDLVVIDESHNFRNNVPRRDHKTRYARLMEDILKKGVQTKVLMLSATPVNNKLRDLRNQVYFITEDDDRGLERSGIHSINEVMRQAQRQFNTWMEQPAHDREELINTLDGRYFKILDLLTIARSRKHIEKYYDTADIGTFPERLAPVNLYAEIDQADEFPDIGTINTQLLKLNLANYQPMKYIRPDRKGFYEDKYDYKLNTGSTFRQESREESLINLMRVNFLKRLESSIYSFQITMGRMLKNIDDLIAKIEHWQNNQRELYLEPSDTDDFAEDDLSPELLIGDNVRVLIQDLDLIRFKDELQRDRTAVSHILRLAQHVTPDRDAKLLKLREAITEKVNNPLNAGNRKVLVFTAFADTATYLYGHLAGWAQEAFGIHSGLVTGGSGKNRTNLPDSGNQFSEIILNFSPRSKGRGQFRPAGGSEIDLLIGTDCISEGQNLQDCDYLVNYDIHWNPVRIVQRFGRIDRIGSTNAQIQLVNFWPNMDLNAYINLINRVKGRMVILDISATGDENVIETDQLEGELDYRTRQLKELQDRVIDLEDLQGGISITDLTFNDFKVDLDHLTPTEVTELEAVLPGHYAVVRSRMDETPPGAIFCLRHLHPLPDAAADNPLYPYYLIYIAADGTPVYTARQPKRTLDALRNLCLATTAQDRAGTQVQSNSEGEQAKLAGYRQLLTAAMDSIRGVADRSAIDSLANPGGTVAGGTAVSLADYELINFFVVT